MISKILVPVDGSATSLKAADYAIDLASKYGAIVVAIHVIPVGEFVRALGVFGPTFPEPLEKQVKTLKQEAGKWLSKIEDSAKQAGVSAKTEVIVSTSSPARTIVDHAERENVDLILMGTRGQTDVAKVLIGSTATGVMNNCRCAITIVK